MVGDLDSVCFPHPLGQLTSDAVNRRLLIKENLQLLKFFVFEQLAGMPFV